MNRLGRALTALAGVVAVGIAAALAFAPEAVEAVFPIGSVLESTPLSEPSTQVLLVAIVGGLCTAWVSWAGRSSRSSTAADEGPDTAAFERLRSEPPELATPTPTVGAAFDEQLDADGAGDEDAIRPAVRRLALRSVVRASGCEESAARERIETGAWTDDPIAAAYVADRESALPFRRRLRAWLRPDRTRTDRIERALSAIERTLDGGDE